MQERGEGGVGNLRLVSLLATSPLVPPTYLTHDQSLPVDFSICG